MPFVSYLLVCVCVFYTLKELLKFFPRDPNVRFIKEIRKAKEFAAVWMVFLTGSVRLSEDCEAGGGLVGDDWLLHNFTTKQRGV